MFGHHLKAVKQTYGVKVHVLPLGSN